jgi:hypothetical protein
MLGLFGMINVPKFLIMICLAPTNSFFFFFFFIRDDVDCLSPLIFLLLVEKHANCLV